MTVGEWLARREPKAPPALSARLLQALGDELEAEASGAADVFLQSAERLLGALLRGDCHTREAALELLTADALVTYAFEAASEHPADLVPRALDAMRRIAALDARLPEGATSP